MHVAKKTEEAIEGSPTIAMNVKPRFDAYCFIDLNADKTGYLHTICGDRQDVDIHTGDLKQKISYRTALRRFNIGNLRAPYAFSTLTDYTLTGK